MLYTQNNFSLSMCTGTCEPVKYSMFSFHLTLWTSHGTPPWRPLKFHLMACAHTHTHMPRHTQYICQTNTHSCHSKTPSKLAPLLPCDYGECFGRRRRPNRHLADSSEGIFGEKLVAKCFHAGCQWWRAPAAFHLLNEEQIIPNHLGARGRSNPFYFLDALTMFSLALLVASERWALPEINWINCLIDPFTF